MNEVDFHDPSIIGPLQTLTPRTRAAAAATAAAFAACTSGKTGDRREVQRHCLG